MTPTAPASHRGATYEGKIIGNSIMPDYSSHPSAVYTVPALAGVGLGEEEATAQGLKFETRVNDMTSWRSARTCKDVVGRFL